MGHREKTDHDEVLEAVREYRRRGWSPTPLAGKIPAVGGVGWQVRDHSDAEFTPGRNVGIIFSNGLVDVDLDAPQARAAAPYLLPETNAVFGRASTPCAHWLFRTEKVVATQQFSDPQIEAGAAQKGMLVELRSGNRTHQTMVPPSLHPETGERLVWAKAGDASEIGSQELVAAVRRLAAAALLARNWPRGKRHPAALALAGALASLGWTEDDVIRFITALCAAANNEELDDRLRAVKDTFGKLAQSNRATGWPTLRKLLGAAIVDNLGKWLEMRQNPHEPNDSKNCGGRDSNMPTLDEVRPPEYADDALALGFSERHATDLRYTALWGRWSIWDGTRWRKDDTLAVFDLSRKDCRTASADCGDERLGRRLTSAQTVYAVERLARADRRHAATADQWDRDPWLLNTPAGTLNLRTGIIQAHCREDYCTKITAASPGGPCPKWHGFLNRITAGNQELQSFLQRIIGYSLTGVTQEHALFFLYGTGGNGKGVFLNTISRILGDYSATAPVEAFLASTFDRHPTDLAGMQGARLVTAIETEEGRRWAESKIKALTGGDPISARFMRQDFFEYVPQFKLVVAGNHKPGLRNVDAAMRRRLNLVPFTGTIPAEERDTKLEEKLVEEWNGILQWAIEGCLEWQRAGLRPPAIVQQATEDYLAAEDALGRWLEERCEASRAYKATTAALFADWREWCETSGEHSGSEKKFSQTLEARDFQRARIGSGQARGFTGLALRCDLERTG
jgi:P4 family phage/plasmid primase-like protien